MKTVIEMAREAGIVGNFWPELERFAELVRADEREACAKVADGFIGCDAIVHKIRARSNT
jgi:hypothetical protein